MLAEDRDLYQKMLCLLIWANTQSKTIQEYIIFLDLLTFIIQI